MTAGARDCRRSALLRGQERIGCVVAGRHRLAPSFAGRGAFPFRQHFAKPSPRRAWRGIAAGREISFPPARGRCFAQRAATLWTAPSGCFLPADRVADALRCDRLVLAGRDGGSRLAGTERRGSLPGPHLSSGRAARNPDCPLTWGRTPDRNPAMPLWPCGARTTCPHAPCARSPRRAREPDLSAPPAGGMAYRLTSSGPIIAFGSAVESQGT